MRIVWESVKKFQQNGRFEGNLKYKNAVYLTKMFPVIILIIGDALVAFEMSRQYNEGLVSTYVYMYVCLCIFVCMFIYL